MTQLFKLFKSHCAKSMALLIEIIIVTIIGWMVVQPVAVKTSLSLEPSGYDYDRLVSVNFQDFDMNSEERDTTDTPKEVCNRALLDMIKQLPEVESATYSSYQLFESSSSSISSITVDSAYNLDDDNKYVRAYFVSYMPGTDFFTTFGIKTPGGEAFVEPEYEEGTYVVSDILAKSRYADGKAMGRMAFPGSEYSDASGKITGIVKDASYSKNRARCAIIYAPIKPDQMWKTSGITIRLKPDANPRVFTDNLTADLGRYRAGNRYLTHPQLYSDMQEEMFADEQRELSKGWVVLLFFLANVILGVSGTFYIQTRSRASDAGVMRAYGATRLNIQWGIIGEAFLTVLIGWAVGSLIYLAYLHFGDVAFENDVDKIQQILNPKWYDSSWPRNTVVGILVLLLLLISTFIGAWMPARKITRISPVDALRDE